MTEFLISKGDPPLELPIPGNIASLESILCTEELSRRPSRPPDYEKENRALLKLESALADSPETILQTLTETILEITRSDSAGVSLLTTNDGGKRFYWPAIAGQWKPHIGGGTPRDFGPCGDVLDRNCPLLMQHIERRYTYFQPVTPLVEECLLVPFYVGGKAVGTIWAVFHDDRRKYDSEDERVMGSLGKFAASAYQTLASIDNLKFQVTEREKAETALLQLNNELEARVQLRTEELEELTQQLRRREAYLAEAQRLSHTGSFGWSVASGKIVWSDETFRIFGFDRETEPTVNLVLERIHPDDRAMVRELIDRASDGKDFDIEYRLLFPDGAVKHVHVVAHAMKDELGSLEFVGAVMDVTQARRARAALHARADVSAALSKALPIREVLRECAEVFVRRLDASFARIWTINPQGTMLELQASAGIYTRLDGSYSCIPLGHLKVGSIASEKKPHLTNDVLTDPRIADKEWARNCGIVSFAGYPLLVEKRAIGVMAMFSRCPLSGDTLDTLASVADAIAQEIDRKRAEAELEAAFKQIQVLKDQLYKENIALREEIDKTSMFEEIVGRSPPLKDVLTQVSKVAPTDSTVLITGETGTGKELIARAIHKRSGRASRVFVSVNCAGIPPALVASELFGHEKGAFTGALQRRIGRFESAEGGTIFLDEIGELPAETQIALLRVLQEREFERVGGGRPIRADIRLIAATNRDLKAAIASGSFRSDLFYRLNVFPIEMPCLRARKEDVPLLAEYFIHRYAGKMGKKISKISRESLQMLQSYPWPGNIRELQNVIERSVIICETETLTVDASWFAGQTLESSRSTQPLPSADEKTTIEAALAETRGRVSGPSGAAVKLGMPGSTLESKIRALKINKHSFKAMGGTKSKS